MKNRYRLPPAVALLLAPIVALLVLLGSLPAGPASGAQGGPEIPDGADKWVATKLVIPDSKAGDMFGASVGIARDIVVVGAPGTPHSPGAAYIFQKSPVPAVHESDEFAVAVSIGPIGGTLTTTPGPGPDHAVEVTLTVPQGAVDAPTEFSIDDLQPGDDMAEHNHTAYATAGQVQIGSHFDFEPAGVTFSQPLTVTFTYDKEDLPAGVDPTDIRIEQQDEGAAWADVPDCTDTSVPVPDTCISAVDPDAGAITGLTNHFTSFTATASAPGDFPETGGSPPPSAASGSPYVWLAVGLVALLVAAGTFRTHMRRMRSRSR